MEANITFHSRDAKLLQHLVRFQSLNHKFSLGDIVCLDVKKVLTSLFYFIIMIMTIIFITKKEEMINAVGKWNRAALVTRKI
jgi:hypothetical protein